MVHLAKRLLGERLVERRASERASLQQDLAVQSPLLGDIVQRRVERGDVDRALLVEDAAEVRDGDVRADARDLAAAERQRLPRLAVAERERAGGPALTCTSQEDGERPAAQVAGQRLRSARTRLDSHRTAKNGHSHPPDKGLSAISGQRSAVSRFGELKAES